MHVLIILPTLQIAGGNRQTADRYTDLLEKLGHTVMVRDRVEDEDPDVVIAIHGEKSHDALAAFRSSHPATPVVLVLAGTDIYPAPADNTFESMRLADRLVTLQDRALSKVPAELRAKASVIVQSAEPPPDLDAATPPSDSFDLCVVGHLREVKDPLRAAAAARLLPADSRIRIRHAGRIRDDRFTALVEREEQENPRYSWLGELAPADARRLIATSRLQVLSSIEEGGAQVLSESIVSGTPLLASRHEAALALLGAHYPGLFDVGGTQQLAALMARAESEPAFLDALTARCHALAPQFDPSLEREAWQRLLSDLRSPPCGPTSPADPQPD